MQSVLRAGAFAVAIAVAGPASAETITYFTGPAGGSWVPIAGAIKNLFEKAIPGLEVENRPGAGLINLKAIEEGKAQLGMGNMISTVDALKGIGQGITAPYKNVCHMASLYPQVQHIAVRGDQGVETLADLKGKTVATLPRGNTTEVVAAMILELAGVAKSVDKMVYGSIADQANMFKDGQVDASFNITTAPSGAYMDMANSREIRMLDIPDDIFAKMKEKNGGFERYVMPKTMYPGMKSDQQTVQFPAHLLVSCKVDPELAYKMTKALVEGIPTLQSVNASFKNATVKTFGAKTAVPFHPGAEKYYKQQGVI